MPGRRFVPHRAGGWPPAVGLETWAIQRRETTVAIVVEDLEAPVARSSPSSVWRLETAGGQVEGPVRGDRTVLDSAGRPYGATNSDAADPGRPRQAGSSQPYPRPRGDRHWAAGNPAANTAGVCIRVMFRRRRTIEDTRFGPHACPRRRALGEVGPVRGPSCCATSRPGGHHRPPWPSDRSGPGACRRDQCA